MFVLALKYLLIVPDTRVKSPIKANQSRGWDAKPRASSIKEAAWLPKWSDPYKEQTMRRVSDSPTYEPKAATAGRGFAMSGCAS